MNNFSHIYEFQLKTESYESAESEERSSENRMWLWKFSDCRRWSVFASAKLIKPFWRLQLENYSLRLLQWLNAGFSRASLIIANVQSIMGFENMCVCVYVSQVCACVRIRVCARIKVCERKQLRVDCGTSEGFVIYCRFRNWMLNLAESTVVCV